MFCSTAVVTNNVSPPDALILASCAEKSVAFGSITSFTPMTMPLAASIFENSVADPMPKSLLVLRKSAFLMPSFAASGWNALASISEVGLIRKM